jgi:hypothetical protein
MEIDILPDLKGWEDVKLTGYLLDEEEASLIKFANMPDKKIEKIDKCEY